MHTGITNRGHLHVRSIEMSATASQEGGCDTRHHGRAMRPAALMAWYAQLPEAVKLLHDWCAAWREDTLREGQTKPADVMPAIVDFASVWGYLKRTALNNYFFGAIESLEAAIHGTFSQLQQHPETASPAYKTNLRQTA